VVWLAALSLALRWCVRRLVLYGVDEDEGRRVIAWGFIGMIFGAYLDYYIWDFMTFWNDPSLVFDLSKGGVSEKGAIWGALVTTLILCKRGKKISFFKLCEAVVPPGFFAIALGRWGCFFAGCCTGIESAIPWGLHFPYDVPYVSRHATQLYYSLSAVLILLSLLFVEKWSLRRSGQLPPRPLLTPLGFIFYSIMRISVDPLRANHESLLPSNVVLAVMIPFAAVWFLTSWSAFRKTITYPYNAGGNAHVEKTD